MPGDNDAPLLIDASRLVWRRWSGTRATGIDRICLAWLEHYHARSQAVIVYREGPAILPTRLSQALFRLLLEPERPRGHMMRFRAALAGLALSRAVQLRDRLPGRGRFWLNPGHTGLDAPRIAAWTKARHVRPVHLVHDLIPITHPQFCRAGEDERHRRRMRTALGTACGIIANSAATRESLAAFASSESLSLPPTAVAWPGTPILPLAASPGAQEPTFVVLGTIEGRKNHALLLELWRQMMAQGGGPVPRLVIVGRRGWQAEAVFAQLDSGIFGDRVVEVGALDDRALAEILTGARALLFPSFAEGYGIPLVEALAAGVPVIASDLPVFREIGLGVPELLALDDLPGWLEAVRDYTCEPNRRRKSQLQRLQTFRAPDWATHFTQVDNLLTELS